MMPLECCINGDVFFLVGYAPHRTSVDNEIAGWLGVHDPKETDYDREIPPPAFTEEAADTSVFNLLPMVLPLPFNHGLSVGYAISGKITGEKMIEAWNIFTGAGENSHQWIDTPFPYRWEDVMSDGGKKMALCWGQAGKNNTEPPTSQCRWPLRAAALSCYWKLWLEALDEGFTGDEGRAWNEFTAQAMASIPEDFQDNIHIFSMTDLMPPRDINPPDRCYPAALLTAFNSQLDFVDKKISIAERSRRATPLKAIALAQ
jgi:hypothetical protein